MHAITVSGLVKRYGDHPVVDGLDLVVPGGTTLALLGPNGAGKTTTVEILTGHRHRTSGRVDVLGADPQTADAAWRARIGVVTQSSGAFDLLTPTEALRHLSSLYPDPMPIPEVLERLDLRALADQRIGTLSGGQSRRVDVACGIVGRPELLFLDEPTTGLDPEARRRLWHLVDDLGDLGTSVLLTTHYLDEVEALADEVVVVAAGRQVAAGTPASIGGRSAGAVEITFTELADLPTRLAVADTSIHCTDGRVTVTTMRPTEVIMRLGQWARSIHGITELPDLQVRTTSLEDVYLSLLTTREPSDLAEVVA